MIELTTRADWPESGIAGDGERGRRVRVVPSKGGGQGPSAGATAERQEGAAPVRPRDAQA